MKLAGVLQDGGLEQGGTQDRRLIKEDRTADQSDKGIRETEQGVSPGRRKE